MFSVLKSKLLQLCLLLTMVSCKNNVSITTEETPTKRIKASCDNGLLKKSNCIDTDDGTTDDVETEEPTPTPSPTVTPTATATPTATPTPEPPQFIDVTTGEDYSCGLTSEGKAYCWGDDGWTQLGNGATSGDQRSPVAVDISTMTGEKAFIKLDAGRRHACGLTAEGIVWCWGRDAGGQVGNGAGVTGDQVSPSAVDTSAMTGTKSFMDISSFYDTTCGLTAEGKAWCWGTVPSGTQTAPEAVDTSGMTGEKAFIKVDAGMSHICGITSEGKAWCWGSDTNGRLGNGAVTGTQTAPSAVDISGMTGDKNFSDISAGNTYTCALTNEGKAWCWGSDEAGSLGNGAATTADQTVPSAVDISAMTGVKRFSSISTGNNTTCAVTVEGKAWCWGYDDGGTSAGMLGDGGALADQASPSPVDTSVMSGDLTFKKISSTNYSSHLCALTRGGNIWCWGEDSDGQLGNGTSITGSKHSPSPVDTTGLVGEKTFTKISSSYNSACAITAAGKLACWGDGDANFGNGGAADKASPALFDVSAITGDKLFSEVATGAYQNCGITTDGQLWRWTNGAPALLDTSAIASEKTFVKAAALWHGCAIASDGKAWCWGSDASGQLGNGAGITGTQTGASAVDTSTMTGATTFIDIAIGVGHTCGINTDGKAWCWGLDADGQLGNGAGVTGNQVSPSAVDISGMSGEKAFIQITASEKHTCALTAEGKVWCWGDDSYGNLGNGAGVTGDQVSPTALDTSGMTGDKSFKKVSAGTFHVCGLTSQGKVWCWGWDNEGQLGDGAALTGAKSSPSPLDISTLSGETAFQDIASGWTHSCALTSQGKAWCWGGEDDGALGNGGSLSDIFVVSPVAVDDSGI